MAQVLGTQASETINAADGMTNVSDRAYGLNGADAISGLGGNDFLYAGAGNDTVDAGSGNDMVEGGNLGRKSGRGFYSYTGS